MDLGGDEATHASEGAPLMAGQCFVAGGRAPESSERLPGPGHVNIGPRDDPYVTIVCARADSPGRRPLVVPLKGRWTIDNYDWTLIDVRLRQRYELLRLS